MQDFARILGSHWDSEESMSVSMGLGFRASILLAQ